jgi:hypothetical protein
VVRMPLQTDPQLHQRLRHLRLDAGQNHLRLQQSHLLRGVHQRIGNLRIDHVIRLAAMVSLLRIT